MISQIALGVLRVVACLYLALGLYLAGSTFISANDTVRTTLQAAAPGVLQGFILGQLGWMLAYILGGALIWAILILMAHAFEQLTEIWERHR